LFQNSVRFTKIVSCGKMSAYRFVTTVSERSEVLFMLMSSTLLGHLNFIYIYRQMLFQVLKFD